MTTNTEKATWNVKTKVLKYEEDITPFEKDGNEAEFHKLYEPYEVVELEGNCLLNTGIDEIWDLVGGGSANHFDNTNSRIGVGDSSTAADPAQTDLLGSNKTYKAMEATYPTSTTQQMTFKSSFGSGDANYNWEEWVVKNNASSICMNRKVESLGTKSTGTWTLEVDITLS